MKKISLLLVTLSLASITAFADMNSSHMNHIQNDRSTVNHQSVNNQTIDVMTPLNDIISKNFDNYVDYEKYAHDVMMTDNSKYITNDTGNLFAVYMTLHHEAAIITSLGIENITTNKTVKQLANNIAKAQIQEVTDMQNLISSGKLNNSLDNNFEKTMTDIMNSMMDKMIIPNENLNSEESTKLYLSNMIIHHEGAIEMAKAYLKVGKNPTLIKISNDILKTQQKEINQMKRLLNSMNK